MATEMDQACREWSHGEMSEGSQEPECHVLDHGSISFGRFAVESLSWEKWSVFSHNRCQEELERFRAPGLVAQKKAYFEEYYKRIRELKALQQEQETAAALNSGGNGSVCSRGGEEHSTSEVENTSGVTSDTSLSEVTIANVSIEKEKNFCSGSHLQYLVPESTLPNVDSSRSGCSDRIKVIGQHKNGFNYLMNECSTRRGEHPLPTTECLESNSDTQATLSEQTESIAECDSRITPENNLSSNQVNLKAQTCKGCTSMSKVKGAVSPIRNTRRSKHDSVQEKAVATSAKNNVKLDQRLKDQNIKSSQGFNHPLDKPADRAGGSVNLKKLSSSKNEMNKSSTSISSNRQLMERRSKNMVSRPFLHSTEKQASYSNDTRDYTTGHSDSKASSSFSKLPVHRKKMSSKQNALMAVSSNRSPMEVRSNITIPRPFTLSTERRAAAPTSTRDRLQGLSVSKASNRLEPLPSDKTSKLYMQNSSVDIAVKGGMRGTALAARRSANPHAKDSSNQHSGHEINLRSSISNSKMGKKQNEVKGEPESKQRPRSLQAAGSSKNGTPKSGHKKDRITLC